MPRVRRLPPPGLALLAGAALVGATGCSSEYKKLASGGSAADVVLYDLFGADRDPAYYYSLVKRSHDEQDFCYLCSDDPYVVDKNIDAIQRLGHAQFGRLEGQAQVLILLQEVLIEDRSALARAAAATSLTRIGLKLPRYPGRPVPDAGTRFLALSQELRALYGGGTGSPTTPPARQRAVEVLRELGDLSSTDLAATKSWLREFSGRTYLVEEQDPTLRAAIDTATVKRSDALVRTALRAGVEDPEPEVRVDAIRGLKTLGDVGSVEAVLGRLSRETNLLVRLEGVEFLGHAGGPEAVAGLLPLLDAPEASVRAKARGALAQVAGRDHGLRRRSWEAWARARYPGIRLAGPEAEAGAGPAAAAR